MIESPNLIFPVSAFFLPNFEILVHPVFLAKIRTGSISDRIPYRGLSRTDLKKGIKSFGPKTSTGSLSFGFWALDRTKNHTVELSYPRTNSNQLILMGPKNQIFPVFPWFGFFSWFCDFCELITPFGFLGQDFPSKSSC